jgi:hypothetical protein
MNTSKSRSAEESVFQLAFSFSSLGFHLPYRRRSPCSRAHGCCPSRFIPAFLLIVLLSFFGCLNIALAQSGPPETYSIYIDTDDDAGTGCTASVMDRHGNASIAGAEYLVEVKTSDQQGVQAASVTLSACGGSGGAGAFGSASAIGAGQRSVVTGTDAGETVERIEWQLPVERLGLKGDSLVALAVAARGDYLVEAAGQPIRFHVRAQQPTASGATPVPSLGWAGAMVLAALVAALGWRCRSRAGTPVLLALLVLGGAAAATGSLAWAGQQLRSLSLLASGWGAIPPLAQDASGDHVAGTPDLRALYAAQQEGQLVLRIDAATGSSPGPGGNPGNRDLSPMEQAGDLPRFTTVPTLLAQAGTPWSYQVRATDSQGSPLAVEIAATGAPQGMALSGTAPEQRLRWTPPAQGRHSVELRVRDGSGRTSTQGFVLDVSDDRQLPAHPADRASPQAPNLLTPFAESTRFLHEGTDPIQQGVAPGALDPVRARAPMAGSTWPSTAAAGSPSTTKNPATCPCSASLPPACATGPLQRTWCSRHWTSSTAASTWTNPGCRPTGARRPPTNAARAAPPSSSPPAPAPRRKCRTAARVPWRN